MKKWIALSALLCLFALNISAQTGPEFIEKAIKEVNKKKFEKALDYLNEAIDLEPDSGSYYYLRGQVNYALGVNKKGASDFATAVRKNPADYATYYLIGQFYYLSRMFEESEDYYSQGLKLPGLHDTIRFQMHLNRSSTRQSVRDFDGAFSDLLTCFQIDSTQVGTMINISSVLREKGDNDEAERWLLKAEKKAPADVTIKNNLGYYYIENKAYEKAIKYLDYVIEHFNDFPNDLERPMVRGYAHSNRGFCYFNLGNNKKATADFENGIKYCPQNSYVYRNRALMYISQKKYDNACKDLNMAVALGFTDMYGPEVEELLKKHCR